MPSDPRSYLARKAAAARAKRDAAAAELAALERAIAALESIRPQLEERERRERGLTKVRGQGTVGTQVTPEAQTIGSKVSQAKTKHPWPFSVALHAHGSSPAQWALSQVPPQKPETVRSWLKAPGKGGRPIPRADAERIEAEFAGTSTPVPARDSSWPNKVR